MTVAGNDDRTFSRRRFLKSAAAALGAAGLGPVLAACAAPPTTQRPSEPASAPRSTAAAPAATAGVAKAKRGGTLRIAVDTLGPEGFLMHKYSNVTKYAQGIVGEYPFYYDVDQPTKLTPGLVESWNTPDMKQWTFKIRKGVQWDKGQGEVTAEDFVFTLGLLARQDSKHPNAPYWRSRIKFMKVVDPYTLAFNFDSIEPELMIQLSPWSATQILCKKHVEAVGEDRANQEPVGSGPYRLVKFVPGSQMEFEAIGDSHWRVVPKWDRIEFQAVPEDTTRFAMLRSGRADLIVLGSEQITEAQQDYLVIPSTANNEYNLFFGGLFPPSHPEYKGTDPWQDVRVREAMSIAIDREAINNTFYAGQGTYEPGPGTDLRPLHRTAPLFMDRIPYDPSRARQLLKEAGKEGFELQIASYKDNMFSSAPQVVEAIAGYWQAIGLKPNITPIDREAMRGNWIADKTNGIMWPWAPTQLPGSQSAFAKFFYSKQLGFKIYSDAHLDSLYEQIRVTGDEDKVDKMLMDAQVYLLKKWSTVHILNKPTLWYAANRDKVSSWTRNNTSLATTWEYIEPKI